LFEKNLLLGGASVYRREKGIIKEGGFGG